MYSIDVAFERLDEQDRKILQDVMSREWKVKKALILGSGKGRIGIALALLGFEVVAVDLEDHTAFYETISSTLNFPKPIIFKQVSISDACKELASKQFSLVLAQRVIHYLPYSEAIQLVQNISRIMNKGASFWFSISPLHSDMGENYLCAQKSIDQRFCTIAPEIQKRFNLYAPVCLYEQSEVENLLNKSHLIKHDLYITSFGNIKGHYKKTTQ
jgi:SAM-dependent methyltransferase